MATTFTIILANPKMIPQLAAAFGPIKVSVDFIAMAKATLPVPDITAEAGQAKIRGLSNFRESGEVTIGMNIGLTWDDSYRHPLPAHGPRII